ncbi:MAG TPA: AAA family ATPase [Actinomycetota bacterium]|nr:AAA family ATPase [Actinomycetota bacterium]
MAAAGDPCPRCGEPLPAGANFCPNCGAPVSVSDASERRVVTVVFVDLAGSTELAARLDPERFRDVIAAFHGMVAEEIAWLGGVTEGFIGDAVLGVFGIPAARDDDAVRGIRAAVAVRDRAERLGRDLALPMPMHVRIGVNTGAVAVGTATDRNIVIGAEVNIGARLQQAASPDEILAGATTVQLAAGAVEFGTPREVRAKGFEDELLAWPVAAIVERAKADRSNIRFVDRRRELALLNEIYERAANRGRAHLVTLLGEPGIGKSRVVEEFLSGLPATTKVLSGRSSPFEEEVTFWPLAQMVYRELGEQRGAPEAEVLDRLRALLEAWLDDPDEVEPSVRRLGFALGVGEPGGEDDRFQAAEVRRGMLTLLSGLAARSPVVLVFEDLQQADPLMLDLIEQLVKEARRVPLMVVCVARWDFLQERSDWAGGLADAATLWVEALAPEHAVRLAMEAGGLDREDAERVALHAGGNPFFIIEITGMLLRDDRDLPPAGPGPSGGLLPPTVQAVIAARIDHLSTGARSLVRRASVFPGGRFDEDELAFLIEPRAAWLEEAREEEILLPDEERPGVWRFRSDVLRDVAYESLAKRERRRLHLKVAEELAAPAHADRYPRTIAFHLEQAARASLDLDPKDRALADRAVEALSLAGDVARRRFEPRAAAELYVRALSLAGPEEAWSGREAWLVSRLGETRYWLGEFDDAEADLRRALAMAGGDDRVTAHAARYLADITLSVRGDDHLAAALSERALEAARRLGEPFVLSRTLLMAGWVPYRRNRMQEAEAIFREALTVARGSDRPDPWAEVRALVAIASVWSLHASEEDALAMGREALEIAERSAQPFTTAIAHQAVAASLRRLLRLDEALEHAEPAVRGLRELGARWELASALGERGTIQRLSGRTEEAEADLREAVVLCRDLRERSLVSWTIAELARTLVARGDPAAARAILDDPLARTAEAEPGSATALLVAESAVALSEGDREAALAKAVAAIASEDGEPRLPNPYAAQVWWTGSLFGPGEAGGDAAVEDARGTLVRNGWHQSLREPELVP